MWVRIVNNNLMTPVTIDLDESILTRCEYKIFPNGRSGIIISKDGYNPKNSLEGKMTSEIVSKANLNISLMSGQTAVKEMLGYVQGYTLTTDNGKLVERVELSINPDGVLDTSSPVVMKAATVLYADYRMNIDLLSIYADNLNKDDMNSYNEHVDCVSVYGVQLSPESTTYSIDKTNWNILLGATDKQAIEDAIVAGAENILTLKKGWNGAYSEAITFNDTQIVIDANDKLPGVNDTVSSDSDGTIYGSGPSVLRAKYVASQKALNIFFDHLSHDENHDFHEKVSALTVFGVQLTTASKTTFIDHPRWDIFLSDADKTAIEAAIAAGAEAELSATEDNWNGVGSFKFTFKGLEVS